MYREILNHICHTCHIIPVEKCHINQQGVWNIAQVVYHPGKSSNVMPQLPQLDHGIIWGIRLKNHCFWTINHDPHWPFYPFLLGSLPFWDIPMFLVRTWEALHLHDIIINCLYFFYHFCCGISQVRTNLLPIIHYIPTLSPPIPTYTQYLCVCFFLKQLPKRCRKVPSISKNQGDFKTALHHFSGCYIHHQTNSSMWNTHHLTTLFPRKPIGFTPGCSCRWRVTGIDAATQGLTLRFCTKTWYETNHQWGNLQGNHWNITMNPYENGILRNFI